MVFLLALGTNLPERWTLSKLVSSSLLFAVVLGFRLVLFFLHEVYGGCIVLHISDLFPACFSCPDDFDRFFNIEVISCRSRCCNPLYCPGRCGLESMHFLALKTRTWMLGSLAE
ncbi:hypothetical protein TNCV_3732581 [Trichonephila clavipes]|nr:hypothetical protein TNCV_3732581 [Trichonephila clavipes]